MTSSTEQVLKVALDLSEVERADLVAHLIDSLDPALDDEVQAAWDEEIRERIDEIHSGAVAGVPWPEARRRILEGPDEPDAD